MSRLLVKCYGECEEKKPKAEMQVFGGKNHCPECYSKKVKQKESRTELYHYIQQTYNLTFPTGLMLRQIKKFNEENGYSYRNIMFTLIYVFEIKRCYSPQTHFGVAFVPYFYEEMLDYYRDLAEKRKNTIYKTADVVNVVIKAPTGNTKYKGNKLINMETLIDGGKE